MSESKNGDGYVPGAPVKWWANDEERKLSDAIEMKHARAERRRNIGEALACLLVVAIFAAAFAALLTCGGCSYIATVPPAIVDGIATLESNTRALDGSYRGALEIVSTGGTAEISSDRVAHDNALMDANERLAADLKEWADAHREGGN